MSMQTSLTNTRSCFTGNCCFSYIETRCVSECYDVKNAALSVLTQASKCCGDCITSIQQPVDVDNCAIACTNKSYGAARDQTSAGDSTSTKLPSSKFIAYTSGIPALAVFVLAALSLL